MPTGKPPPLVVKRRRGPKYTTALQLKMIQLPESCKSRTKLANSAGQETAKLLSRDLWAALANARKWHPGSKVSA